MFDNSVFCSSMHYWSFAMCNVSFFAQTYLASLCTGPYAQYQYVTNLHVSPAILMTEWKLISNLRIKLCIFNLIIEKKFTPYYTDYDIHQLRQKIIEGAPSMSLLLILGQRTYAGNARNPQWSPYGRPQIERIPPSGKIGDAHHLSHSVDRHFNQVLNRYLIWYA